MPVCNMVSNTDQYGLCCVPVRTGMKLTQRRQISQPYILLAELSLIGLSFTSFKPGLKSHMFSLLDCQEMGSYFLELL